MKRIQIIFSCVLALWASALSAQSWTGFDYHPFQYEMTVYYTLSDATLSNYEIAAFVDDECRGVGEVVTATGSNGLVLTYGYLKVYSNIASGETVTFRYFNKKDQTEKVVNKASVTFTSQGVEGLPSAPLELALGVQEPTKGDVNTDEYINTRDIVEIVNYIVGKPSASFNQLAADANGDGNINITDIILIVNAIE